LKSSYQHIIVRCTLLLFAFGSFSSHAQPSRHSHKYFGFNLPLPKNKNPNELLHWLNNKGYPYAQLELDTLMFDGKSSEFTWNISPGKRILLDTIITPNILFNKRTLQRCLNYEPGQPYSTDKVQSIGDALSQISFLKPNAQVSIRMHSETFSITIKADRKKNNVISALIALQPKPNSSQSILTGNIDLELSNALKQAETIEFHWKRPQPKSQSLAFKLGSPFTAGLPVGFQFEFASFLRDSTFSSTDLYLRLLTKTNDLNGFSAAVGKSSNTHFQSSSLFGNTQNKTYSLRYSKNNNSNNSINFLIEGLAGTRTIQYETSASTKKLYALRGKAWSKFNLTELLFSNINLEVNGLFSDSLFNNEISRLGGTKNLRAFIEESIYASQYAMLNCDFGVNLGSEIQSFLFADFAKIQEPISKIYYDAGLGFRFQQENGSLSITYGIGNIENNGLQLKNGRVGITFSSRF
jgi:outer membrane protein assembly factor BamA